MTEQLAIDFILRAEWQIWAGAFLLAVLGGAISALLFIPLANLWLMLAPAQEEPSLIGRERAFGLAAIRVVIGVGLIGVTVRETYQDRAGREVATVAVMAADCRL